MRMYDSEVSFLTVKGDSPMRDDHTEPLMDRKTAARYLRVSPGTLAVWDCTKRYNLNPLKVGRSVRYRKVDLDKFMERQLTK